MMHTLLQCVAEGVVVALLLAHELVEAADYIPQCPELSRSISIVGIETRACAFDGDSINRKAIT